MDDEFRYRLLKAMSAINISAADLARKSGVDKGSLSNYINGEYVAKQGNCYKLAKALGVDPGWLLTGDEPIRKEPESIPLLVTDNKQEIEELLSYWRRASDTGKYAAMSLLKQFVKDGV